MSHSAAVPSPAGAADLAGLLSEPGRLRVVAALALGSTTLSEIADRADLDHRAVTKAVNRLQAGGLVSIVDSRNVLNAGVLLRAWHSDYATLRRYLVDEELLAREANVYWRVGSPVLV